MSEVNLFTKTFYVYLANHFWLRATAGIIIGLYVINLSSCRHLIRPKFDCYSWGQPQGYPLAKSPGSR